MTQAALALGSNLANPRLTLRAAVEGLWASDDVQVVAVSSLWRSAAVGGPPQPDYLNAVVLVETTLEARALLRRGFELEVAAGRVRAERWGPRTLDVDVLAVAGQRSRDAELTLPHPRAHLRAFVLRPWAEVDPEDVLAPDGEPGRTIHEWAASVDGQGILRLDCGGWWR